MPYIGSSRYKYSPYLTVHFGKTEKFTAGDAVEPWTEPSPDLDHPCAFDKYMEYLGIDYWWKMQGTYTAIGQSEANVGTAGLMPLTARGSVTSLLSNQPALTKKTCEGKSITKGNNSNGTHAAVLVNGDSPAFTMGGWFNTTSLIIDSTGIFKTNPGYLGSRTGIHVRPLNSGVTGRLVVTPSAYPASSFNKAYLSPTGSYPFSVTHFVVLRVQPTNSTVTLQFDLFIDGVKQTMTDTGNSDHAIYWNTEDPQSFDEIPGIYYSSSDGQSQGSVGGGYDELFFHWGLLTDQQIMDLYTRGS